MQAVYVLFLDGAASDVHVWIKHKVRGVKRLEPHLDRCNKSHVWGNCIPKIYDVWKPQIGNVNAPSCKYIAGVTHFWPCLFKRFGILDLGNKSHEWGNRILNI